MCNFSKFFIGENVFDITTSIDLSRLVPLNQEGKNSSVYSYYDQQLGKDLIVKVIDNETAYKQYGSDYKNNLFAEAKILYATKHPNIVEIQYASYDKNSVYISMPKCKNGSLDALINSRYLTVREILKYSIEFLSGLHYIHTKELVHFDIKPTNILINDNGKAVLTDFGLAKYVDKYGLASPDMMYNMHKTPEHFINSKITNKSDIYQAGVTMYRLCNGNQILKQQFDESKNWSSDVINGKFPNRKGYLPHIPLKLQRLINKAMNVNPDKRFDTVLDMINKLSEIVENLDWKYHIDNTTKFTWTKLNEKGTHEERIILTKNTHNTYDIKGQKTNLSNSVITNISKWENSNISLQNAYKLIAEIIKSC